LLLAETGLVLVFLVTVLIVIGPWILRDLLRDRFFTLVKSVAEFLSRLI